jgi:hypothetical protein
MPTTTKDAVRIGQLVKLLPGLRRSNINWISRHGGHGIEPAELRVREEGHRRNYLYVVSTWRRLAKAARYLPFSPGKDEYTGDDGQTWIWIPKLRSPFSSSTIKRHAEWGRLGKRDFVVQEEHDAFVASRGFVFDEAKKVWKRNPHAKTSAAKDLVWATAEEAWADYRLSRYFLDSSERPEIVLGKPLDTKLENRLAESGRRITVRVYRRAQLELIRKRLDEETHPEPPPGMMRLHRAVTEFGIPYMTLMQKAKKGKLGAKQAQAFSSDGKLHNTWFVSREKVEALSKVEKDVGQRAAIIHLGEPYYLLAEAAKKAGVHWLLLSQNRNKPSKLWGGIVVKADQIRLDTFGSKWSKTWIYRAADLDKVQKFLAGESEPVTAQPGEAVKFAKVKKKRGRPRITSQRDADFNYRIAREWKKAQASGQKMETFGTQTRDVDSRFLGKKGVRRILQWVERNPKKAT